ncbi:unnamed protein product [Periconia digitata]|uniref:Uncharacterized protein n=1 Tax=Periconia digitata TaxID=1303443 RepID=A0A9W4URT2_9PLEO|nr:unnamed protein product [Periconia digitata]
MVGKKISIKTQTDNAVIQYHHSTVTIYVLKRYCKILFHMLQRLFHCSSSPVSSQGNIKSFTGCSAISCVWIRAAVCNPVFVFISLCLLLSLPPNSHMS